LENAHNSLFNEYRWRVQDLPTFASLFPMFLRASLPTGMR
jgi:hypothetical protein